MGAIDCLGLLLKHHLSRNRFSKRKLPKSAISVQREKDPDEIIEDEEDTVEEADESNDESLRQFFEFVMETLRVDCVTPQTKGRTILFCIFMISTLQTRRRDYRGEREVRERRLKKLSLYL